MNDRLNALKEYMNFYSRNLDTNPAGWMGNTDAHNWAQQMIKSDQARPETNYFAEGQGGGPAMPAYVQPQRFEGQMPERQRFGDRLRPQVQNYLSQLLGGR